MAEADRRITAPVRRMAKRALRSMGAEVRRLDAYDSATHRRFVLLAHRDVDLVIDVGANAGQYGTELRQAGYGGRIVSLEPLAAPFAVLSARAERDANWDVIRTAVGAESGEVDMNVAANSYSSSVLSVLPASVSAAPASAYIGTETVPLAKLDDLVAVGEARAPFLKIDTQGYEAEVLAGAERVLAACTAVELELSLVPLYEGQPLLDDMLAAMTDRGFQPAGFDVEFWNTDTGEALQVNGTFVRP